MRGKVQTVLGWVDPEHLGRTLPHEHLETSFKFGFVRPENPALEECPFTLENLGWIRQYPYSHRWNITYSGPEVLECLKKEMIHFKEAGGGTIVENTTYGISRNLSVIKEISELTKVHIVAGTGFYVNESQPPDIISLSEEDIASIMRKELTEGCSQLPEVKCGIIGEIGSSWPITDFERRAIQASAEVLQSEGAPVMFHPGRSNKAPAEILRIFQEAGGDVSRCVMAHLDRTFHCDEELLEFASLGSFLEHDLFGIEVSLYQLSTAVDMPSDAERIRRIGVLKNEGYLDRLLMAHDIHTKHRLVGFGGHGFKHIFQNVVPVMLRRGFTSKDIDQILVHNPAKWLPFSK